MTAFKICGLRSEEEARAAADAGASMIGLMFVERSPRFCGEDAPAVARGAGNAEKVGVFVDPDDAELERAIAAGELDALQLHGGETPERITEIKRRFGLKTIRVARIGAAADLEGLDVLEDAADMLLLDAKPPAGAAYPGGHGAPFDWRLLRTMKRNKIWALAGGLTPGNVGRAIEATGAPVVDVSSGVEAELGVKDLGAIAAFAAAVEAADERAASFAQREEKRR